MKHPIDEPLYTEREVISLLDQCLPRGVGDGVCSHLSYLLRQYQDRRDYKAAKYIARNDNYLNIDYDYFLDTERDLGRLRRLKSQLEPMIVDIDVVDDTAEYKDKIYVVYAPDGEGEYRNWDTVSKLFQNAGWIANWIGDEKTMPCDKNIQWKPDDDEG
jgi:hypothetical protein